jgi:chemotaxis response regulator CheB
MPAMLRTIITDLLQQEPDLVIVGCSGQGQDPLRSAHDDQANVLITQDCTKAPGTCLDTILSAAPLGIFALSADGQNASTVRLVRQPVALNSLKRTEFADAIRRTAEHVEALPDGKGGMAPS